MQLRWYCATGRARMLKSGRIRLKIQLLQALYRFGALQSPRKRKMAEIGEISVICKQDTVNKPYYATTENTHRKRNYWHPRNTLFTIRCSVQGLSKAAVMNLQKSDNTTSLTFLEKGMKCSFHCMAAVQDSMNISAIKNITCTAMA